MILLSDVAIHQGVEPAPSQSKPLCASVQGFSLHASQSVSADDREALERLLRYRLRAPFSQKRLSRSADGKVVYRLRRPWPSAQGATHLIIEPLDFLRRLAALVSFPYSHAVRYHPRCSTPSLPMLVLAFLADPDVVAKILRHLGLPTCPPALAPARSSAGQPLPVQQLPLDSSPAQEGPPPQADGNAFFDPTCSSIGEKRAWGISCGYGPFALWPKEAYTSVRPSLSEELSMDSSCPRSPSPNSGPAARSGITSGSSGGKRDAARDDPE